MIRGKRRILVIGSSGAGKSTLSIKLGAALGLPVVHLDRHYWQPAWREPPDIEWDRALEALLAAPAWIMDGNYDRTLRARLRRADAAIFLDLPPVLCRYRILKRVLTSHGRVRSDMAEGCPEQWDWSFLQWVWAWPRDVRPLVADALKESPASVEVIQLRTRREVAELEAAAGTTTGGS